MSVSTHFMKTRSMAKKKKGTPQSTGLTGSDTAALIDRFSEEEYKPRPAPMYKPPPIQKPAPEVGKATQQKAASSGPFIFSFGRIWTGKPALDLLHGPDFPSSVGPAQARAVVISIIEGLKKRNETHEIVTQGRTLDFKRIRFELDDTNIANHQHHLFRCFTQNGLAQQHGKLKLLHAALESELFYIVCWNRHAFPELIVHKEYSRLFPSLFPGNTTSMFAVLQTSGLTFEEMEPNKPSKCALRIFTTFLAHVEANAPESLLLRAKTTEISSPLQMQAADSSSTAEVSDLNGQVGGEATTAIPDHLLTLALTPENFYTALVRTLEASGAGKLQYEEKVKEAVEAVMYRLAIKDPLAFPDVFSVLSEPDYRDEEHDQAESQEAQDFETVEEMSARLEAVRLVKRAVGRGRRAR